MLDIYKTRGAPTKELFRNANFKCLVYSALRKIYSSLSICTQDIDWYHFPFPRTKVMIFFFSAKGIIKKMYRFFY